MRATYRNNGKCKIEKSRKRPKLWNGINLDCVIRMKLVIPIFRTEFDALQVLLLKGLRHSAKWLFWRFLVAILALYKKMRVFILNTYLHGKILYILSGIFARKYLVNSTKSSHQKSPLCGISKNLLSKSCRASNFVWKIGITSFIWITPSKVATKIARIATWRNFAKPIQTNL